MPFLVYSQPAPGWFSYSPFSREIYDIFACSNGDLIASGGGNGWTITRFNNDGESIWQTVFECNGSGHSVIEADNGDLLIGGERSSLFSVMRLSSDGELIWWRDYGAGTCNGVIELKSGDIAAAGYTYTNPRLAWLIIMNGNGEPIINRRYDGHTGPFCWGLREAEDGVVLCGHDSQNRRDLSWLRKVDYEGDVIWYRENQEYRAAMGYNIMVRTGNTGFAYIIADNPQHPGIVRTDSQGNLVWRILFEDFRINSFPGLLYFPETGFLIVCGDAQNSRPLALFLNMDGELIWQAAYEDRENNEYRPLYFRSAVIDEHENVYSGGIASGERSVGLIALLGQMPNRPTLLWSPYDTLQTVLAGESIEFSVFAEDIFMRNIRYNWFVADSMTADEDTSHSVTFNSISEVDVEARITAENSVSRIIWHVTVTDLFIAAHSPDTLNLALRRGSSVDFAIDSVAAIEDEQPVSFQWTLILANEQGEVISEDSSVTIDFLRSGHYIVEGMAYRGDSHDEVVWDVEVRGAIWSFLPEELNVVSLEGDNVEFQIIPTISDSLNWYTWLYDGGMIREGWDSVFVMDLFELGEHRISGILADSVESDTVEWVVNVLDPDGIEEGRQMSALPAKFGIESVSPNPFNAMLTIRFSTGSQAAPTRLAVYDLSGREVASLLDDKSKIQNLKSKIVWNASSVPAGVYLVRLHSGSDVQTRKVVLLK